MFAAYRKRQALKRYAQELPRCVARDYGGQKSVTSAQIAAAVHKLKLDPTLIVYAYAMFLSKELFDSVMAGTSASLSYEDARIEFLRQVPSGISSSEPGNTELGVVAGAWGGAFSDHDGSGH
jgi:hypothetical protein